MSNTPWRIIPPGERTLKKKKFANLADRWRQFCHFYKLNLSIPTSPRGLRPHGTLQGLPMPTLAAPIGKLRVPKWWTCVAVYFWWTQINQTRGFLFAFLGNQAIDATSRKCLLWFIYDQQEPRAPLHRFNWPQSSNNTLVINVGFGLAQP
jgi:hypothetical protein